MPVMPRFRRGGDAVATAARAPVGRHVRSVQCPTPGGGPALFELTAELLTTRLRFDRPLWSATFVSGPCEVRFVQVVVFHRVLADGMSGLAVLAGLVDGAVPPQAASFPRAAPTHWAAEVRRAARIPTPSRPRAAARTFAERRQSSARCTDPGALGELLASRGATVAEPAVSMPVAGRDGPAATGLGNHVGVPAVTLPVDGDPLRRLQRIAGITRTAKASASGASAVVLLPLPRILSVRRLLR